MKYEPALQSTLDYLASDYCHLDLDDEQATSIACEQLTSELVNTVLSDRVMSPQAVAVHANKLFSEFKEQKMQHSRVVPPRVHRFSDDELRARVREALDDNGMSAYGPIGDLGIVAQRVFEEKLQITKPLHIVSTARTMLANGELNLKVHVRDAKDEAFALADDGKWSDTGEATRLVLEDAEAGGIRMDAVTAQDLVPFIKDLGRKGKLALSPRGEEQERIERGKLWQAQEEEKLVKSITEGRDQFQIFCKDPGRPGDVFRVQTFDSASLKGLSLEKLRELDKAANDLRRRQKLSPDDQRDELREQADKARGHAIYREGDRTELDGTIKYREGPTKPDDPGARYQFVGEHSQVKPTAGRMDRSVLIPPNLAPTIVQLFTDPATRKLYTKTALHGLATSNRALFRKMMSTHVTFMNELLKQDN